MSEPQTVRMEVGPPESLTGWAHSFASSLLEAPAATSDVYQSLFDNSPFVFLLKDEEGRLIWCNRLCAERWGIRREDWIGKLDTERWPAEEARLTRERDLAVLAGGRVVETWEKEVRADGTVRYWMTCRFPFQDESGERHVASLAADATRMAEAEMALQHSRHELEEANRRLAEMATTDALTGIRNRRAFDERLQHEFALALRHNLPISVMLLDVDHFKEFNDRKGHGAGDEALREMAQKLQAMIRSTDMVARYGGEEFIFVLPNTARENALMLAARIARTVAAMEGPAKGLTVSIGVAAKTAELLNRERLIALADEALYMAKETGRNRIVASSAER